ncbi:MAG: hypothetical protein WKF37_24830 [Bryobacteraceae bacterium]
MAVHYSAFPFPEHRTPPFFYYYGNPNLPLTDALALLALLVELRPHNFIEIGSGYSSCTGIDSNERYLGGKAKLTFIDPDPTLLRSLIGSNSRY